jgi:hypothetical protein
MPVMRDDEDKLTEAIIHLASNYGCYDYRRITAMLHRVGFEVSHKCVERIWREQRASRFPEDSPREEGCGQTMAHAYA